MIAVDFNILNQKGSPAFYSDTFANRPAASLAGRIFIATNTGNLYRDTGTSWVQIAAGGGPGTTPGIDDVLAINQLFTNNRDIDCNSYDFNIGYVTTFTVKNSNGNNNFLIDSVTKTVYIGDGSNLEGGTCLNLDYLNFVINTFYNNLNNGFYLDQFNGQYTFGAVDTSNRTNLFIDDSLKIIYTSINNIPDGLQLDFYNSNFQLGYINGGNQTNLQIDDANGILVLENSIQLENMIFLSDKAKPSMCKHLGLSFCLLFAKFNKIGRAHV